jgi:thiol-disulfide isomerase/thioredoxin
VRAARAELLARGSSGGYFAKHAPKRIDAWRTAAKTHPAAQWLLARCLDEGIACNKDEAGAVKLYRKSAEAGFSLAQNSLAVAYDFGLGVEQDAKESVRWLRKAAEQGEAAAQDNLGLKYENGRGVTEDAGEAVKWFRKASAGGYGLATVRLVLAYEHAWGVEKNAAEANRLRALARKQFGAGADELALRLAIQKDPIDKQAPNAEGTIAGKKFKLSDSRGKVVVMVFTASWCGHCREMAPHLKGLVARLKDKPFALLEVDTDKNAALTDQWGVRSVPSIYVLDSRGVIRFVGCRGKELDEAVAALLQKQKVDRPKK